jgi:hypothetical protein
VKTKHYLRGLVVVALCATLWTSMGCQQVLTYAKYRAQDALEMVDVGFSITTTPQIGLYWNSLDALTFGYCKLDGYFLGWGGNQIGFTRLHAHCWGLGYAYEEIGWGDYDLTDPKTLYITNGGIPGYFLFWVPGIPQKIPAYSPACVHFFPHIAYVGLVWNARWWEILDFLVGFSGIDLSGDDGNRIGSWLGIGEPQWPGLSGPPPGERQL